MTYLIADTHFGHNNIIAYESRPFPSVDAMDTALIANWNNVVTKQDHVFILGDFLFGNADRAREVVSALHGHKTLVLGNHDRDRSVAWWQKTGLDEVIPYPIVLDEYYICSHEPIYLNTNMPYFNIFGHVHQNPMFNTCSPLSYCVCAERVEYTPIDFNVVKSAIVAAQ